MKLASLEMLRNKRRYISIMVTLALINILLLFLVSQLTGLLDGQSGALENQKSNIFVYQKGVEESLFRSNLALSDTAVIENVDGVSSVGPMGILFGAASRGSTELFDLGVFGYDPTKAGSPSEVTQGRLPKPGESGTGAIDESAKSDGVEMGDKIVYAGAETPVEVVGFTKNTEFQLQPTLWVDIDTWRQLRDETQPELASNSQNVNAFAVETETNANPENVASSIDEASSGIEALTTSEAVAAIPGYSEQRQTFVTIIAVTYIAAALVITLFFVLITLEKTYQLGVLKALGANTRQLIGSTAFQGLMLSIAAYILAGAFVAVAGFFIGSLLPFSITPVPWLAVFVLTAIVGSAGALASARRIGQIDPATAVSGGE